VIQQAHCTRCGGDASVIDNEAIFCGKCFLDEALLRRRRLSPAPRWRMRRQSGGEAKYEAAASMR
jgi:hypothetical protein